MTFVQDLVNIRVSKSGVVDMFDKLDTPGTKSPVAARFMYTHLYANVKRIFVVLIEFVSCCVVKLLKISTLHECSLRVMR
jgi:hypothetical protein